MSEGFEKKEVEAPFNMGIATLKRLDIILQQIRGLGSVYIIDSVEKQKAHIELVRQFYINAVPLFSEPIDKNKKKGNKEEVKDEENNDEIQNIEEEILDLDITKRATIKSGSQKMQYAYNKELEKRLNEIMIKIQSKLKKFFMPGKSYKEGML